VLSSQIILIDRKYLKNREKMNQENYESKNSELKITDTTILFFDLDGTLVDTNYANFLSYKKAIQSATKSQYDLTFNPAKRFNRVILKNYIPNLRRNRIRKNNPRKGGMLIKISCTSPNW